MARIPISELLFLGCALYLLALQIFDEFMQN
jgi:hypothetical protein